MAGKFLNLYVDRHLVFELCNFALSLSRSLFDQILSGSHFTHLESRLPESHRFCKRVQDAYTLRCCPQVHGIVHDTIEFVREVITTEMNSATDNPVSFAC